MNLSRFFCHDFFMVEAVVTKQLLKQYSGKMKYKTVYLHRIIAEYFLGRSLRPGEVVHHLDEDKTNNSPENLIVCSSASVHRQYHRKNLRQKLEPDHCLVQVGDLWL